MKRYRRRSRGYPWLFTFLLLNQERGVHNERSQSIQTVRHSKRTHHMWPHQKDLSTRKEKKKKPEVFFAHSAQLAVLYIGPCIKVWYRHISSLFDCRLHSEIMDIYMPVYKLSQCLKRRLTQGDFTLPDYLPCYFRKSSFRLLTMVSSQARNLFRPKNMCGDLYDGCE